MGQDFFYCSELSRTASEKTYGTASTGDLWLLVEYPFAWGPKALHDSILSPQLKAHLNGIIKSRPHTRLLFIKQDRACRTHINFFIVRSRERNPFIVNFQLSNYHELLEIDVAAAAQGRVLAGGSLTKEPLLLVCTHGRRDKCCAKFGYPLFKYLRREAGDSVWQSSHVGGDRFAANLICFPHGLFYAHVTEESGKEILGAYGTGRLLLEKYRGRACYASHVQAAEFFVRSESGINGIEELRVLSSGRLDEKSWLVKFFAPHEERVYEVQVASRLSEFQNFVTCHASTESSVLQYSLASYQVLSRQEQLTNQGSG
jgi:hypothetical protein